MRIICSYQGKESFKDSETTEFIIGRPDKGVVPHLDLTPDERCRARAWIDNGQGWLANLNSDRGTQVNGEEIKSKESGDSNPISA